MNGLAVSDGEYSGGGCVGGSDEGGDSPEEEGGEVNNA
jgi:hypothetical protein